MASGLGKLAGVGAAGEQLLVWQVLGAIISAVLEPELQLLTREVNKLLPATPLSPAELSDMVVRNIVDYASAASYASESGVSESDFKRLVQSAGEAPSPQELVTALRRGIIPHDGTGPDEVSFVQGIAEGRTYTKYTQFYEQLANIPISVSDAVDAVVESQIDMQTGEHYAFVNGVSAEDFQILINTRGNPPSPAELANLLKRGLIPLDGTGPNVTSFQQGIAEGASKNKWWELFARLADYIPPARTVVSLIKEGSITDEQATAFLQDNGLTPDLIKIYIDNAHAGKSATHKATVSAELRTVARRAYGDGQINEAQFRDYLQQADVPSDAIDKEVQAADLSKQFGRHVFSVSEIKRLRQNGLIDDDQARQRLLAAGWSEDDAQTQINEWVAEAKAGRTGLTESRILSYLVSGIIDPVKAYDLLIANGINSANATFLVQHPEASPAVKVHGSTTADIVAAYKDGILTQTEAEAQLESIGDTADSAALKLQVANYQLNRGPKPKLQHKNLSEAQVIEAFKIGLVADTWVIRELTTMGYTDADASLLVTTEQAKLAGEVPASWAVLT